MAINFSVRLIANRSSQEIKLNLNGIQAYVFGGPIKLRTSTDEGPGDRPDALLIVNDLETELLINLLNDVAMVRLTIQERAENKDPWPRPPSGVPVAGVPAVKADVADVPGLEDRLRSAHAKKAIYKGYSIRDRRSESSAELTLDLTNRSALLWRACIGLQANTSLLAVVAETDSAKLDNLATATLGVRKILSEEGQDALREYLLEPGFDLSVAPFAVGAPPSLAGGASDAERRTHEQAIFQQKVQSLLLSMEDFLLALR
jgi:hypothetical protein